MADPVIYVTTFRIKEGKSADYRRFYAELLKGVRESVPRIIAFHLFANEDDSEMTSVQVHPDAGSMADQMKMLAERMGLLPDDLTAVLQYLEVVDVKVLGDPGQQAREMDKQLIEAGTAFSLKPQYVGGLTRSTSA